MPVVRKSEEVGKPVRKVKQPAIDVELPMTAEARVSDFTDIHILMHGEKKVGKTLFFAQEKDNLVLEFDPLQPYRIKQIQIPDWATLKAVVRKLELLKKQKGRIPYPAITIDRADLFYRACFRYVCEKEGFAHPNDEGYGKGWDKLREELSGVVHRLFNLAPTRWISHSVWKEVKRWDGDDSEKLVPDFPKQMDGTLTGLVDVTAAYIMSGKRRLIVVDGDERVVCGCRRDKEESPHFYTPDGRGICEVYAGTSAGAAYANVIAAFQNKQSYVTLEEYLEQRADRPKKSKLKKKGD